MKEHNEIDSLFESVFDGLTLTPDASVKENIDKAIASKKKRRRFLFILFPLLFGVTGFAATAYFYPISGKPVLTQNEKQPRLPSGENEASILPHPVSNNIQNQESESLNVDVTLANDSKGKLNTRSKINTSTVTKIPKRAKTKTTFTPGSKPVLPEPKRTDFQVEKNSEKSENEILVEKDEVTVSENTSDSILSTPDSTTHVIAEILKSTGNNLHLVEDNEDPGKWSLAVLTYWEGEKKRDIGFQDEPFINNKREIASIHSSTFYGKIEINRKFGRRWELLTGVGFRSSKIIQYGSVDKIEFPLEGLGSVIPINPPVPDTVLSKHVQSFRVNSVVLPIGFGYSIPLKYNMRISLAAGAEFAYGQFARETLDKNLSAPALRPFGCSVWIRPELYYSFGRIQLFGFGTFNQTLSQQLRWNFEPRRNPAFGGGIGLRIQL